MARSKAETAAEAVLEEVGITKPPVPVEKIARAIGLELAFEPFEDDVSGMLYREDGRAVIGVNSTHPRVRQRFSIAHEIAHYKLHKGRPMIVDRSSIRFNFRDQEATLGTNLEEVEANQFAAALLMPRDILKRVATVSRGNDDADSLVTLLAVRFDVSNRAMEFRLTNLGIATPR